VDLAQAASSRRRRPHPSFEVRAGGWARFIPPPPTSVALAPVEAPDGSMATLITHAGLDLDSLMPQGDRATCSSLLLTAGESSTSWPPSPIRRRSSGPL
jgi:hypothetical protein